MSQFNQIVEVDFHGDRIQAVQDHRGVWVSLRRMCESLGLGYGSQTQKLKSKPWTCATLIVTHDVTGRAQEAYMLHLDCVPMWLATIESSRVKEEARPMLELYQKECARVLFDHFFGQKQEQAIDQGMLLRLMQSMADAVNGVSTAISALTARVLRLEEMGATQPAPQFIPAGGAIGIMEQVRKLWRTATEKQRNRCVSRVQAVCRQKGIVVWKPLDNGPLALQECNAHIINDVVNQIRELDEAPLFTTFANRQSAMSN